MARIPVFCPNCKSVFPSRAFNILGNATLYLSQNFENCAVCGYPYAQMSDGVFQFSKGALTVIEASDITRSALEAFAEIARQAAASEITQEEAVDRAAELSPALAKLIDAAYQYGGATLMMLFTLIGLYLNQQSVDLARRSLEVSEKSLRIAEESSRSTDAFNEKLLQALTEKTYSPPNQQRPQQRPQGPPEKQPSRETSPVEREIKPATEAKPPKLKKPKAKSQRRSAKKERSGAFGGSRTR